MSDKIEDIINFRGDPLLQSDAVVIQELESFLGARIKLVRQIQLSVELSFTSENFRVSGIGIYKSKLEKLPDSIGDLKMLKKLYVVGNIMDFSNEVGLKKLPSSIGNLMMLEELNLYGNMLVELPNSIGQLNNLRFLDLSSNDLEKLPEAIGGLTSLKDLDG